MEEQGKILSEKELGVLLDYIDETYEYFLFNRIGHDGPKEFDGTEEFKGIGGEIYHNRIKEDINFEHIWNTMLRISEFGYLSYLANIFDKPSHFDKKSNKEVDNIVFCRIANKSRLIGCESTLEKIKEARNKFLDHIDSDLRIYNGGKSLSEVMGLDKSGKDVKFLFDKIYELLDRKIFQEAYEKKMAEKFTGWYNIFVKGYPKSKKVC